MTLKATNAPLPVEWSAPDGWRVIEAVNADVGSGRLAPLAGVLLVEGG